MDAKLVLFLAMFCAAILVDTEAFRLRFRLRRIWRRVKPVVCGPVCSYGCASAGAAAPVCGLTCSKVCGRRRRDANQADDEDFIIGLPRDFKEYDTNHDGGISAGELAGFLKLKEDDDELQKAFDAADSNGDSVISEDEFQAAPWIFAEEEEDQA